MIIDPKFLDFFKNVYGDEHRITQLLINFLSNAFKMTPNGGSIKVEVIAIDGDISSFSQLLPSLVAHDKQIDELCKTINT